MRVVCENFTPVMQMMSIYNIIFYFHPLSLLLETEILEGVPLTISYHLYFLSIPKVSNMLHHVGQWGEFTVKNAILYSHTFSLYFLF